MQKKIMRTMGVLAASFFLMSLILTFAPADAKAQQTPTVDAFLGIYNVIDRVEVINGNLVAFGQQDPLGLNPIPLELTSLGRRGGQGQGQGPPGTGNPGQGQGNPGACPILNLQLGPINLNLLGLLVETSQICLEITAHPSQGLLGDLLCGIARLLDRGLGLNQILGRLSTAEQQMLTDVLRDILNGALNNLNQAVITGVDLNGNGNGIGALQQGCPILNLELGPLDLNILGLRVYLHDCDGGPVTIDITAIPGGGLLGNLLCGLLFGPDLGGIIGDLLQDFLNNLLQQLFEFLQPPV
jgi:hypothetical protein